MNSITKTIALALVIAAGASAAQARPVLNDLVRTSATVSLHGVFDGR